MKKIQKLLSVASAFIPIADKINEVIAANPPLTAGEGIQITDSKENRLISIKPAASAITPPWYLTGTDTKIYIKPGMVNNFIPTIDLSGTPTSLAAFPAPSITVTGATGIIELKATVDSAGTITALIAQNVTTASTDTSTNKYKTLGTWTTASGAFTSVTSILNTNQTFRVCNGTAEWY